MVDIRIILSTYLQLVICVPTFRSVFEYVASLIYDYLSGNIPTVEILSTLWKKYDR